MANREHVKVVEAGAEAIGLWRERNPEVRLKLRKADLVGDDLFRANLSRANLNGAVVGFTIFGGCDLREVEGLDKVVHGGPSTIGIDTIIRSGGNISPGFLKEAGVPDTWVEYIPYLTATTLEFYSAFLSHSHLNKGFADQIYGSLKGMGIRIWYSTADTRGGRRLEGELYQAIRWYDKVMVA